MKKLAVVIMATNEYLPLGIRLIKRMNYFCLDKENIDFYLYSDVEIEKYFKDDLNVITDNLNEKLSWMESVLVRFDKMKEIAESNSYEYVVCIDADSNVHENFYVEELVANSITFLHYSQDILNVSYSDSWQPFHQNPDSVAYYDASKPFPSKYYQACYIGGSSSVVIDMANFVKDSFQADQKTNSYPTKWTDEAYLQKYFETRPPEALLTRNNFPIKMEDKGNIETSLISGVFRRPFFELSELEYEEMLNNIANTSELWDIVNNSMVLDK